MALSHDIKRALRMPPWVVAGKVLARARRTREAARERSRDLCRSTYLPADFGTTPLARLLELPEPLYVPADLLDLAPRYLAHEADLLGSGWVSVGYGVAPLGVEGHTYDPGPARVPDADGGWLDGLVTPANLERSRELWRLVDAGYEPIDWQRDFKSGHRWAAITWYRDVAYGTLPGVDVKVPWELARMQHLPQLALVALSPDAGEVLRGRCAREIRNQVLDFAATNPPRFGACWTCTMDVAIRIVNALFAVDLLHAGGLEPDEPFMRAFGRMVAEHARFISENLEWSEELRGNHYLSDVCGWLFAAAYLGDEDGFSRASSEVLAEAVLQFDERGANFEGSTSYHRLSGEMLLWSLALLLRRGVAIPDAVVLRVPGIARFAADAVRPDGRAVQFGDTDSGRFLKLVPDLRGAEMTEDPLRPDHLLAQAGGLLGGPALAAAAGSRHAVEVALVAALRGGMPLQAGTGVLPVVEFGDLASWEREAADAPGALTRSHPLPEGALSGLTVAGYPEFGAWFWRADAFFLALRCGPVGQRGNGGHDHNDQLGIELWIDGEPVCIDPGTYLYTPLPGRRDEYRSVSAHAAPRIEGAEPGRLDMGLFRIADAAPGVCEAVGPRGFAGYHDGFGMRVSRVVTICEREVRVTDWRADGGAVTSDPRPLPFSPGYGLIEDARAQAGEA